MCLMFQSIIQEMLMYEVPSQIVVWGLVITIKDTLSLLATSLSMQTHTSFWNMYILCLMFILSAGYMVWFTNWWLWAIWAPAVMVHLHWDQSDVVHYMITCCENMWILMSDKTHQIWSNCQFLILMHLIVSKSFGTWPSWVIFLKFVCLWVDRLPISRFH